MVIWNIYLKCLAIAPQISQVSVSRSIVILFFRATTKLMLLSVDFDRAFVTLMTFSMNKQPAVLYLKVSFGKNFNLSFNYVQIEANIHIQFVHIILCQLSYPHTYLCIENMQLNFCYTYLQRIK